MKQFYELFEEYSTYVEQYWSDLLESEVVHLRNAVVMAPPSAGSYDTSLVVKSSVEDNEILRMCLLLNHIPELSFLKADLVDIVWKRFYRPKLLYETEDAKFSRIVRNELHDNISAYLRPDKVNRETKYSRPYEIRCVGAKIDNEGRRFTYLQMCFILLSEEPGALERFLMLVFQENLERWLFGVILNRKLFRRRHLFHYRGIDTRPVKKAQRRRGYNDKGTLRDSTIPRPEPFPFALQELEHFSELTKTVQKDLQSLQLKLADEVGRLEQPILTKK